MLGLEKPYSIKQLNDIKILLLKTMEWNEYNCKWVLHDYHLEFVIKNDKVVSIIPYDSVGGLKPIGEYQKEFSKKRKKQGCRRNAKRHRQEWRD